MTAPLQDLSESVKPMGVLGKTGTLLARILLSVFVPIVTFIVLYIGFRFLRDSSASKWVIASVAIIWGVGGVALCISSPTGSWNAWETRGAIVCCPLCSSARPSPS